MKFIFELVINMIFAVVGASLSVQIFSGIFEKDDKVSIVWTLVLGLIGAVVFWKIADRFIDWLMNKNNH